MFVDATGSDFWLLFTRILHSMISCLLLSMRGVGCTSDGCTRGRTCVGCPAALGIFGSLGMGIVQLK